MLNRIYHYSYLIVLRVAKRYLQIFFSLKNDQFLGRGTNRASILALPAYPEGWPGGMERFANWKPYFEKEGIPFDISWPCSTVEYTNVVDRSVYDDNRQTTSKRFTGI